MNVYNIFFFTGDFKRLVGSTIPYQQLKFKSLHHFLKSMPDVVKSEWLVSYKLIFENHFVFVISTSVSCCIYLFIF